MTAEKIAEDLLWPCWRGIPDGYKIRYARNIWAQFEDNIRSAAYTTSLAKFLQTLSLRLGIDLRAEDVRSVNEVLIDPSHNAILRSLRDETTALVLMVRLRNEERKEKLRKDREQGGFI